MSEPTDGVVRLGADITLADMRTAPSDDGQCLLVYCRQSIVAILCAMGSDVEAFEFANAGRMTLMDVIEWCETATANAASILIAEPMKREVLT